jgi:hypothetical protein
MWMKGVSSAICECRLIAESELGCVPGKWTCFLGETMGVRAYEWLISASEYKNVKSDLIRIVI